VVAEKEKEKAPSCPRQRVKGERVRERAKNALRCFSDSWRKTFLRFSAYRRQKGEKLKAQGVITYKIKMCVCVCV